MNAYVSERERSAVDRRVGSVQLPFEPAICVATVEWIVRHPEVPRLRRKKYRRVNLRAFPHYVACVRRGDMIWVVVIAHGHWRPEFWLGRL